MIKGVNYLTIEQFNQLDSSISNKRDKLILHIIYETGCTVNELVQIKIKDIDFKNSIKFPSKNTKMNKERVSYVSAELLKEIKIFSKGKKANDFLFSTRQGEGITTKRVRQIMQSYSKKAGLSKINPQIIRYTHVVHAIEKGIPVRAIQSHIGIDSLRMSQIYDAVAPKETEDVYKKFFKK